jgi:hypothetical protein
LIFDGGAARNVFCIPIALYREKTLAYRGNSPQRTRSAQRKIGIEKDWAISADSAVKQNSLVRKGIENGQKENIGANNGN